MSKMLQLFQIFSLFFNSKTHSFSQLCFLFQHFSSFRRQYPTPKLLILPVLWFSKQHTASFQVIVRRRPIFHLGNQTLMRMLTKSNFLHLSLGTPSPSQFVVLGGKRCHGWTDWWKIHDKTFLALVPLYTLSHPGKPLVCRRDENFQQQQARAQEKVSCFNASRAEENSSEILN